MYTFDRFGLKDLTKIISSNPPITQVDTDYERNRSTVRRIRSQLERIPNINDVSADPFYEHVQNSEYIKRIIPNNPTLTEKAEKINALLNFYNHQIDRTTLFNWRKSFKKYLRTSEQKKYILLTE